MSRTSPRYGDTVRVGDHRIESHYLQFVANELRRYHDRKRRLRNLEDDVIRGTSAADTLGMPRGSDPGNPTHGAALRLMDLDEPTFKVRMHLRTCIKSVDDVYSHLPLEQQQIVKLLYWDGYLTIFGIAKRLHMGYATVRRHRDRALLTFAVDLIGDHILLPVLKDEQKRQ